MSLLPQRDPTSSSTLMSPVQRPRRRKTTSRPPSGIDLQRKYNTQLPRRVSSLYAILCCLLCYYTSAQTRDGKFEELTRNLSHVCPFAFLHIDPSIDPSIHPTNRLHTLQRHTKKMAGPFWRLLGRPSMATSSSLNRPSSLHPIKASFHSTPGVYQRSIFFCNIYTHKHMQPTQCTGWP